MAAVIGADERQSTDELEAWLDDIGTRLEPPVRVSSTQLRESELLHNRTTWLDHPSTLFDLLVRADARDGTARAARYYDVAVRLAHAAAAIDLVPSPDEIAAIDHFRDVLLRAFDAAGVARPGQPRPRRPVGGAAGDDGAPPQRRPAARARAAARPDRSRSSSPSSTPSSAWTR